MHTDILIVGAGPTGLTLAVDLARQGVAATLVEALPALPRQSRGKGLQPRTLEVLDDLGVVEAVLAHGSWRQEITLFKDRRRLARLAAGLAEPGPDVPYPNIVMIPQWRTAEILRDRLVELGGTIRLGTRLDGFAADAAGVTATLVGPDGGRERVTARYLVGCDGGRSTVRRELGATFAGATRATQRYLLGDVTVPGWEPAADGTVRSHAWFGSDGTFLGLAGLPGTGQWQIGASIPPDDELDPSLATLQRLWDERTGHRHVRLADPTWLSNFQVNVRMVDAYRHGRVFLAGDAAHVHPPTGGQGMNTGIQDAYNLGWKLGACLRGAAPGLLDSYESERLPVARGVLERSTDILDVVMSPNRAVAFAVQRVLLPLLGLPALNRALTARVSQIDVGYRGGPLAADGPARGRLRPGDRAPDASLVDAATGRGLRLFDVFRGTHCTLLLVGAAAARNLDPAALPADLRCCVIADSAGEGPAGPVGDAGSVVRDHDRTFRRAYRAAPGTALLVRPDGYLAWRAVAPSTQAVVERHRRLSGRAALRPRSARRGG